jgi:hypothetical protein
MQEGVQIGRVELIDELMIKGACASLICSCCQHLITIRRPHVPPLHLAVNLSAGMQEQEKPTLYFEFSGR